MGILNVTPDSFSGDGIFRDPGRAAEKAERIAEDGADIIDIGGESTRPGSAPVSADEEIKRVIPIVQRLAKRINIPISVDTSKSEVAHRALDSGASIINDITGLAGDEKMIQVAARYDAGVVIMHIQGNPRTMQKRPFYKNLIEEIIERLSQLVEKAEHAGIKKGNIMIDPGIGFGKTFEHNLDILNNIGSFKSIGKPIVVGPSRKSFIGHVLGAEPDERIFGTAASAAIAIKNGADVVRAHDVKEIKQVVQISDAIAKRTAKEAVNV